MTSGVFCRELIGRTAELASVLDRVRSADRRDSAVLAVRGEAGIGKTRLVEEAMAAARHDGFRAVAASTREYANAPYAVLQEALTQLGVDIAVPLDDSADDAKTRRFDAVARAIAEVADTEPRGLLVVVEDLHWADVGTLELLRFLARRLSAVRATIVVTYRPEEIESDSARAHSIVALERELLGIVTLHALTNRQIDRLLQSVITDRERQLAPDVTAQIRELSDGRPLFAEELLRGVFERLDRDSRAAPSVPTTIRVTVRERFAALSDEDRTVLLHAAVLGRRFSARFLAMFCALELTAVYAALRRSRDLQLIVEESDDQGDRFAFRHTLTREAVYAELLRAEARLMHGRVAELLAAEPSPDVAAIAEHLWRAGEESGAAAWSERAGDEAVALYAYADAARAYERAYQLTVDPQRRAHLAERTTEAWYALGDLAASVEWCGRTAEAYRAVGDLRLGGRVALRKARILFEGGRFADGLREADLLASAGDVEPAMRVEADLMAAGLLAAQGYAAEAIVRLERAERLDREPDAFVRARFSSTYAIALGKVGRVQEARERFADAIAQARAIGDHDLLLRTYNNWGNLELADGTLLRARELYGLALAGAERVKNRRLAAWTLQNAAVPALLCGDLVTAHELLERGAEIEHGVHVVHRWSLALDLRLRTLDGRLRADDVAQASTALDEEIDAVGLSSIAAIAAALAHRLAAEARLPEARDVIKRVMPVFDRVEAPYWLVEATARYGDAESRAHARELIAPIASRESALGARGTLAMFDAREALRQRRRDAAVALAESAVTAFHEAGWTLAEGYALELAGRLPEALGLFRRIGATAEVRRNTETAGTAPRHRGESTLTGREREIAGLVAAGLSTRAIAKRLVISERTVETHTASVYRKLGVSSRRALEQLLSESAAP